MFAFMKWAMFKYYQYKYAYKKRTSTSHQESRLSRGDQYCLGFFFSKRILLNIIFLLNTMLDFFLNFSLK